MKKSDKAPEKVSKAVPKAAGAVSSAPAPLAAPRGSEKASKSMTLWLSPSRFEQLDAEVAKVQASCPAAARVTRSSYVMHVLLKHLDQETAQEKA